MLIVWFLASHNPKHKMFEAEGKLSPSHGQNSFLDRKINRVVGSYKIGETRSKSWTRE